MKSGRAMFKSSLVVVALCTLAGTSFAQEVGAPHAVPAPLPSVAITVSPLHLAIPMAEVTVEVRLADKLGVAAIAGVGSLRDPDTNTRISLQEGGVSARYYALGSFRSGLQVGAEALYVHGNTENTMVEVKAAGLGLSPFVGYKWTHSSGFTFDGQVGASFMVARANADTGQMAEKSKVGPLLNLNVGYSF